MKKWKSQKNPQELVRGLVVHLQHLASSGSKLIDSRDKRSLKVCEDVTKMLATLKVMLYGSAQQEPVAEVTPQLADDIYNNNLLLLLVQTLPLMEFEAKKVVSQIFNNLLRRSVGDSLPTVAHVALRKEILFLLLDGYGYENSEMALNCGLMLRECARYEQLAKLVLYSDNFYTFFDYIEMTTFDIASDAFSTFKEMLTRHKGLCASFLEMHYSKVFRHYDRLLHSDNYLTRRQVLKLLGELLLDRRNFTVMTRYVSSADNLKLMMNMMRDKSKNIQFEAFHVFKVFVANPSKPQCIVDILLRNRDKLLDFLAVFHNDRDEDEQFNDEKSYLIKQIKQMKITAQ